MIQLHKEHWLNNPLIELGHVEHISLRLDMTAEGAKPIRNDAFANPNAPETILDGLAMPLD